MTKQDKTDVLFLSGAEMDPTTLRREHPGARFIARARITGQNLPLPPAFSALSNGEVWGILVNVGTTSAVQGTVYEAVTDEGRCIRAALGPAGLLSGSPEAIIAAVRYWELPPDYVAQVREIVSTMGVQAEEEEPRDGV